MFGDILLELIETHGLDQKQFADKLNLSKQAVNGYIKGRRTPNDELKKQIADFFGVTVDYLVGRAKEKDIHILQGKSIHPNLDGIGVLKDIKLSDLTTQDIKELTEIVERITKRKESR